MPKTTRSQALSAALASENGEPKAKGSVIESRTFREGSIYLFKRADYAKPTWLCRVKVPGGKGYSTIPIHLLIVGDHIACLQWLPLKRTDKCAIIECLPVDDHDKTLLALAV